MSAPKIIRAINDPDQSFIDKQVDRLSPLEIEMYEKFQRTDGIRELLHDIDRETLEGRYAYMWNRELEQRVKNHAWTVQNAHDEMVAYTKGATNAAGALRAMQIVVDLDRQGRKTVKIADLIAVFKESGEQA